MKGRTQNFLALLVVAALSGCAGTKNLELEGNFPVPLITKLPVNMGILLDDELRQFTYNETIEGKGEWNVAVGSAQETLFTRLADGMFEAHSFTAEVTGTNLDAVLKPKITDLQFSLPEQTRSNFYEVWIRYQFQLYDADGNVVAEWPLPAYGKASKKDFGNAFRGVEAAAIAACRDAMAFFAINFSKEPKVKAWLGNNQLIKPAGGPTS